MAETLASALVAAQKDMPAVDKTGINPHFRSEFVTLDHLLAAVLPVLNRHGIAVAQFPSANEHGHPTLTTILLHSSGDKLEYAMPLFLPKNDPQGQGSAISYARRYALQSALGVSTEKDDDGESAPRRGSAGADGASTADSGGGGTGSPQAEAATAASTPTDFTPPDSVSNLPPVPDGHVRAADVVCTFGKNTGKNIRDLGAKSAGWYASAEFTPKTDAARFFKRACEAFLADPNAVVPVDGAVYDEAEDVPFL